MEFLKAILGDGYQAFEDAVTAHNALPENKDKQVKIADLGTGEYVGIGKYNALVTERDGFKEKLDTAEGTIKTLKKENGDNEELQKTIKAHDGAIETLKQTYEGKIKDLKIDSALKDKLTDTKYPDLIMTKFDRTKLVVSEDGTVTGIDDQLAPIKEQYKDLFTPGVRGREPENRGNSQASSGKRKELEAIISNPKTPFVEKVAARNQLFNLESEE
jgi:hypothetical protein